MKYKCTNCNIEHNLNNITIKDKQRYVPPRSCYEGDYYVHQYYYFSCDCTANIEVPRNLIDSNLKIQLDYSEHKTIQKIKTYG